MALLLEAGADPCLRDTALGHTPLEAAREAARGPDMETYRALQAEEMKVDVDEMMAGMEGQGLSAEDLAEMRREFEQVDLAESYLQSAREIVDAGDHAEVIRLLSASERSGRSS